MALGIESLGGIGNIDSSGLLDVNNSPDFDYKDFFRGKRLQSKESFIAKLRAMGSAQPPLLGSVAPPRGKTIRSQEPFDFFGTLFTTPATAGLNSMAALNATV